MWCVSPKEKSNGIDMNDILLKVVRFYATGAMVLSIICLPIALFYGFTPLALLFSISILCALLSDKLSK